MKKTITLLLIAMLIVVAVIPAFAKPNNLACNHPNCPGTLYTLVVETPCGDPVWDYMPDWDHDKDIWITTMYKKTPMIRETYLACNQNSNHRILISSETFTKREYVGCYYGEMTPGIGYH